MKVPPRCHIDRRAVEREGDRDVLDIVAVARTGKSGLRARGAAKLQRAGQAALDASRGEVLLGRGCVQGVLAHRENDRAARIEPDRDVHGSALALAHQRGVNGALNVSAQLLRGSEGAAGRAASR